VQCEKRGTKTRREPTHEPRNQGRPRTLATASLGTITRRHRRIEIDCCAGRSVSRRVDAPRGFAHWARMPACDHFDSTLRRSSRWRRPRSATASQTLARPPGVTCQSVTPRRRSGSKSRSPATVAHSQSPLAMERCDGRVLTSCPSNSRENHPVSLCPPLSHQLLDGPRKMRPPTARCGSSSRGLDGASHHDVTPLTRNFRCLQRESRPSPPRRPWLPLQTTSSRSDDLPPRSLGDVTTMAPRADRTPVTIGVGKSVLDRRRGMCGRRSVESPAWRPRPVTAGCQPTPRRIPPGCLVPWPTRGVPVPPRRRTPDGDTTRRRCSRSPLAPHLRVFRESHNDRSASRRPYARWPERTSPASTIFAVALRSGGRERRHSPFA